MACMGNIKDKSLINRQNQKKLIVYFPPSTAESTWVVVARKQHITTLYAARAVVLLGYILARSVGLCHRSHTKTPQHFCAPQSESDFTVTVANGADALGLVPAQRLSR